MKRAVFHLLISISLFFLLWSALGLINWVENENQVEILTIQAEKSLGMVYWDFFESTNTVIEDETVIEPIEKIVTHLVKTNELKPGQHKIHIIQDEEVNAFALPDGHLVLHTGLIKNATNQEELIGVICHEMAHVELRHVVKKLAKEVGLTVLVAMTTGDSGFGVIQESAKVLTSAAFDRSYEREADIQAVDYLMKANVDPIPFAMFLAKLGREDEGATNYLSWANTHPDSKERAVYLLSYCENKDREYEGVLSKSEWNQLIDALD